MVVAANPFRRSGGETDLIMRIAGGGARTSAASSSTTPLTSLDIIKRAIANVGGLTIRQPNVAAATLPSRLEQLQLQQQQARLQNQITTRDLSQALQDLQTQIASRLQDIELQREQVLGRKETGEKGLELAAEGITSERDISLRQITDALQQGLEKVQGATLKRGIFTSGIREKLEGRVESKAEQAKGDVRLRADLKLQEIANRRDELLGTIEGALKSLSKAEEDIQANKAINIRDLRERIDDANQQLALTLQGLEARMRQAEAAAAAGGGVAGINPLALQIIESIGQFGLASPLIPQEETTSTVSRDEEQLQKILQLVQ